MADEEQTPTAAPPGEPAEAPDPAVDELADHVRVGRVVTGRRVTPVPEEVLGEIHRFARSGYIPGLGTLLDLARSFGLSGRGPGLGVEAFSTIRRRLGGLVEGLDAIAIHAGPVLFVKTSAKNQPGTALRWLHEDERRALREHPELLDQPARLTAGLKKLVSAAREPAPDAEAGSEADPSPD